MIHSQEHPIRLGRYCVSALHAHLVFVTKYRRKVFNNEILIRLEQILREAYNDFEVELKEFVGEKDHIHLLLEYPPKVQLSKLINSLKGVSSRLLRQEFPVIHSYLWKGAFWSPSYFAGSCGGADLEVLTKYIESQNRPD
ncbi:IS200/IS605 family transposase [Photobacterium damselae subsp. damselae]|uniref:IS200/IS605 family transposase n=1 Tax=Photobacterium damselae TaxID=38293 RepID=UPI001245A06C|nr:IS200/IS605 family transposase [Photobacterium damselae]KAB1174992.1 IS200/IS605 family transposase [Photobacterium damselae subsp. damselae]UKA31808.1 IS200/IS605 family transposase [Photobacterium damselae subsp. damselae]